MASPVVAPVPGVHTEGIFDPHFWNQEWHEIIKSAFSSLIQIAGVVIAYIVLKGIIDRILTSVLTRLIAREASTGASEERTGRLQTLEGLCKSVAGYVLFFVFGVMLLKAIGFDIMPFVTTAGVIGLAIGFGAQKLVKDVISGFIIIVDNVFVVGDTVAIGPVTGHVLEMGMRVTKLEDAAGRVYILANGDIGTVTNLSRNPVEDSVELCLAANADLTRAIDLVNGAGEKLYSSGVEHHLRAAPRVLGVTAFSAASITLRVSVVSDPRDLPIEQMRVRAALRDALIASEIPLA